MVKVACRWSVAALRVPTKGVCHDLAGHQFAIPHER